MESRKSSFEIQLYLNQQVPIIISYLNNIAKKYNDISEIFENPEKRLFFKNYVDENLNALNAVFNKEELIEDYKNRLLYWRPLLTEISIESARHLIRDFYFAPIKKHPQWEPFITQQKMLIGSSKYNETTLKMKMKVLEEQLAGAFAFRIIAAFTENQPGKLMEESNLLAGIINVTMPANALIVQHDEKLRLRIEAELSLILSPKENAKELLSPALDKLRGILLYQAVEQSEHILWDTFENMLLQSKKSERECEKLKTILATCLFVNSIDNDMVLFRKIESFIDSAVKKKHSDIFEKNNAKSEPNLLRKNKDGLFARKLSAPPPINKDALTITPRNEHSESETTPRSDIINRIRPNARQLRRRTSVVNLFSPRSNSDDVSSSSAPGRQTPTPREDKQ